MGAVKESVFNQKNYLLIVILMSIALTIPITHGMGCLDFSFYARVLYVVIFVAVYALFYTYPTLILIPASLILVAAFAYVPFFFYLDRIFTSVFENMHFWPAVITFLASLAVFLIIFYIRNSHYILLAAGFLVFVPLWYGHVDSAYPAAVFYYLCWMLLLSEKNCARIEGARIFKLKKGDGLSQIKEEVLGNIRDGWSSYSVVILVVALLLALILPKGFGTVTWPALQEWARDTFPFHSRLHEEDDPPVGKGGKAFGLHTSGYQEDEKILGGPVTEDSTVLLKVWGRGGIYLRGSVHDTYLGNTWEQSGIPGRATLPVLTPTEDFQEYFEQVKLQILHYRLNTATVFSVLYAQQFSRLPENLLVDKNHAILWPGGVPRGEEYFVQGLVQSYEVPAGKFQVERVDPGEMKGYLQLPPALPERVKELAMEVAPQEGHYPKIKALESFLRSSFGYNREVPPLPEGRDFVDHFLFTQKEGHCSYFASALAVMGRAAGVPTRYVVGFVVPEEPERGGVYRVTGSHAHAWVEAYIPGLGWMEFEPTPGYRILPPEKEKEEPVPPPEGRERQSFFDPVSLSNILKTGLIFAAVAGLLAFITFTLFRLSRIKKDFALLGKSPPRVRAAEYYNLTLSMLEGIGLGKTPGETPLEYGERINLYVSNLQWNFAELTRDINIALYSTDKNALEQTAGQLAEFYKVILKRYITQAGRVRALIAILFRGKLGMKYL